MAKSKENRSGLRIGVSGPERSWKVALGVWTGLVFLWLTALAIPLDRLPFSVCILKRTTGIPCPSCGGTRSFMHLVHGRITEAFLMNPFWTLVMGLGLGILFLWTLTLGLPFKWRVPGKKFSVWLLGPRRKNLPWLLLAGLLINWVYILIRRFYFQIPY